MKLKETIFQNKIALFRIKMRKNKKSLYLIQHEL